ncbi:MAG: hypothetical protein KKG76_06700, partial [Euryarchaeota archaeon]|nr:hypothetical protein [Euryarchaeota archaeon]
MKKLWNDITAFRTWGQGADELAAGARLLPFEIRHAVPSGGQEAVQLPIRLLGIVVVPQGVLTPGRVFVLSSPLSRSYLLVRLPEA